MSANETAATPTTAAVPPSLAAVPVPSIGKSKKYRRKKRGQTLSRKKKKIVTPRWEPNYRHPASRFLTPEHHDLLRVLNQPKGDDPLPKKIPHGPGLSHQEVVKVMLATMKHRVAEYVSQADSKKELAKNNNTVDTRRPAAAEKNIAVTATRRQSAAYADALAVGKAVADFEQAQFEQKQNKTNDLGQHDPLYKSGLTWGEMTEKRQRQRKYQEVLPSFKSKKSQDPGLSEADPLRKCVSVLERPDYRWTLEGQQQGRRTCLIETTKLPLLIKNPVLSKADRAEQARVQAEHLKRNILNVARASIQSVSTWARYRATYRILLPTFLAHYQKPTGEDDDLFHTKDLVLVHQTATNIWISASVVNIDGFDPDADPEEQALHAHHEKHHVDNVKEHALDVEGEEEHKRLRTKEIDSDSDEEGRGHGKKRTYDEEDDDDDEKQYKLLVCFKNRDRSLDQKVWIKCHIGRLRRQLSLNPKLCDNLHQDMPSLRPIRVGGLPRKGDKVLVTAVDFHCAELYTKLGLLPIGVCVAERHVTDACKIEIKHAVLNKTWVGWYNNRHVQVVTEDWFDAIKEEWNRMDTHASQYKTKEMLADEESEVVFRM